MSLKSRIDRLEAEVDKLPMHPRPLNDRLVVRRESDEKTAGGILLPDQAKGRSDRGQVLAVGPGAWTRLSDKLERIPMSVKVGDTVLFPRHAGQRVEDRHGKEQYLILREDEVLAVVEGQPL